MKKPLSDLLPEEISALFSYEPVFRGVQIFKGVQQGLEIAQITTLPKTLRQELEESTVLFSSRIDLTLEDRDHTKKLRVELADGNFIECILLEDKQGRKTACLSTQVGCAMGCAFCRTGQMGLIRNLESYEIVEQFLHLTKQYGRISNTVFMGMGEPLANLANLRKTIEILHHKDGLNISPRKITISTCGLIDEIYDLADNGPPVKLAISLISADPRTRDRIMPINRGNTLADLKKALAYYQQQTGRRITLEYVLLGGVNDSDGEIRLLKDFTLSLKSFINLIPWNPVDGMDFKEPNAETMRRVQDRLEALAVPWALRRSRGRNIQGACGQLASGKQQAPC